MTTATTMTLEEAAAAYDHACDVYEAATAEVQRLNGLYRAACDASIAADEARGDALQALARAVHPAR